MSASSLHDDACLLDALDRVRLRRSPSAVAAPPQHALSRLTALCERQGIEADSDTMRAAVEEYLATGAPTTPADESHPTSSDLVWQRPQSASEWTAALSATAQAMNDDRWLDMWRLPMALGLILGAMTVAWSHSASAGMILNVFTLTCLGVWTHRQRRYQRRCDALRGWLLTPVKELGNVPRSARKNLARVDPMAAQACAQRWGTSAAVMRRLAAIEASGVPLLAGDMAALDALSPSAHTS